MDNLGVPLFSETPIWIQLQMIFHTFLSWQPAQIPILQLQMDSKARLTGEINEAVAFGVVPRAP